MVFGRVQERAYSPGHTAVALINYLSLPEGTEREREECRKMAKVLLSAIGDLPPPPLPAPVSPYPPSCLHPSLLATRAGPRLQASRKMASRFPDSASESESSGKLGLKSPSREDENENDFSGKFLM